MNPTTIFILQLLGPLYVIVALRMLFAPASFRDMMKSMRKEKGMSYGLGVIMLVACTALIINHNIWEWSLTGLVTLFAWLGAIKSALLILKPEVLLRKWGYMENDGMMIFAGVFSLVLGGYFCYVSYFV